MSNNNHVPWGTPKEVSKEAIPNYPANRSRFEELFVDIVMRLEQTNGHRALMYPFKDAKIAKSAASSVARMFSLRVGKGHVAVRFGPAPDGTPALYVARGPNYK